MKHIDLFSGIGGFALAARWAGIETIQFVELDPFCQKVLAKNFPGVPIHGDITTYAYRNGLQEPRSELKTDRDRQLFQDRTSYRGRPFLLTGGFPCQPFSCAGKRRGKEDDRFLWPEMLRVISEARPTWVIGENVAGFIGMGLDDCVSDLEREGYEVQPIVIPACAVNAPHRRDRVWIVANAERGRFNREAIHLPIGEPRQTFLVPSGSDRHAADTDRQGSQGHGEYGECAGQCVTGPGAWQEPWLEAATRLCRVDARVPNRVDRLKSLGNAIVPQIAYQIIKAIKEVSK